MHHNFEGSVEMLVALFSYSDGGQQSFRNISHNDPNEKDNGLHPVVAQGHASYEQDPSQYNSHCTDHMDEVGDLHGNGSLWMRREEVAV